MNTITAVKLKRLLNLVPDNTPIYIVGENNENGVITTVDLRSEEDNTFNRFEVRIDYIVE